MPSSPPRNAIEKRIEELDDGWNVHAESAEPRLLIWVADGDSRQLIDGWVQMQCDGDGAVPDFFIRLASPFADLQTHGFTLLEELYTQVEAARAELAEEGEALEWSVPQVYPGEGDTVALVRALASFRQHFATRMLRLGVVLAPTAVNAPDGWQHWLRLLLHAGVPTEVRFLVVDAAEAPLLDALAVAEPVLVSAQPMDLDMAGARAELAAGAASDDPGSRFRVHFVALTNAVGRGDLTAAHESGQQALTIAGEQGWLAMQVVVWVALGSGYVAGGHTDHALTAYDSARQAAGAAQAMGDPAAPKLVVQSWFGQGSALVSAGRYAEAAAVYTEAAPVAAANADPLMTLEAWRMASYCHEQVEDPERAWACGQAALDAGEQLDEGMRASSTLPFVGQGLLRITKLWAYAGQEEAVRGRLTALLGPDWEAQLPQQAQQT